MIVAIRTPGRQMARWKVMVRLTGRGPVRSRGSPASRAHRAAGRRAPRQSRPGARRPGRPGGARAAGRRPSCSRDSIFARATTRSHELFQAGVGTPRQQAVRGLDGTVPHRDRAADRLDGFDLAPSSRSNRMPVGTERRSRSTAMRLGSQREPGRSVQRRPRPGTERRRSRCHFARACAKTAAIEGIGYEPQGARRYVFT